MKDEQSASLEQFKSSVNLLLLAKSLFFKKKNSLLSQKLFDLCWKMKRRARHDRDTKSREGNNKGGTLPGLVFSEIWRLS